MSANEKASTSIKYVLLPDHLKACINPQTMDNIKDSALHKIVPEHHDTLTATLCLLGCVREGSSWWGYTLPDQAQILVAGKDWVDVNDLYNIINGTYHEYEDAR